MALQDLTPQLRTRLTKMERAVGWFVFLATVLLLIGFGYYLYNAAKSKGWFLEKAKFFTYFNSAAGLNVGDKVFLMGFQVGEITGIVPMPPRTQHNVRIDFVINQINTSGATPVPFYSYVWTEGSNVKPNSTGFLGKSGLEIARGTNGFNVYTTRKAETLSREQIQNLHDPGQWRLGQNVLDENSNVLYRAWTSMTNFTPHLAELKTDSLVAFHMTENHLHITSVWDPSSQLYNEYIATNSYELASVESPDVGDQLQAIVQQVQQALPNFLALTNKIAAILDHAANATSNLNLTIADTQPLVKNFAAISADLHGSGALGAWVLGSNAPFQIQIALTNANSLLANVDTNVDRLTDQVGLTLINLANITSNLNVQVQANSNMLGGISKTVTDSDNLIQGLKHFWLLRSTFKRQAEEEAKKEKEAALKKNPPPTQAK